jgi:hypothetical protein
MHKLNIAKLDERAEHHDVSFSLHYYFLRLPDPAKITDPKEKEQVMREKECLLQILQKGRRSEALMWLRSTGEKQAHYGASTKEDRLSRAISFAELAGLNIEDLAKEHGLEHLLPPS